MAGAEGVWARRQSSYHRGSVIQAKSPTPEKGSRLLHSLLRSGVGRGGKAELPYATVGNGALALPGTRGPKP